MKWGLVLFALTPLLFGSPQTHPSIASGAKETSAQHLHSMLAKNAKVLVIDVRAPEEYYESHIPQALSIPLERLPKMIRQLHIPKDTVIVTVCDHGGRSSRAALELQKMGYKTSSFCRIDSWKKGGYNLQEPESK
ncbi:MAG TPA: rhodanese-like domain-containing protein [Terriglobia bacterium]|nr:rhodanese-like domain-containing protein [Terriglobia bacterium]